MKALSIKEPWASRIARGGKTIETRTWSTAYRGPLLLCGSARPPGRFAGLAFVVCRLSDCRLMTSDDIPAAQCDWYRGAMAWVLTEIHQIEPFPVTGRLGLFEVAYG